MKGQGAPGGYHRSRHHRQVVAARRRNAPSHNRSESYSHIQVVAHPDANSTLRQEPPSPFVQKRSLQDELYNAGEYGCNTKSTITSHPSSSSFSFAQVAASMSGNGLFGSGSSRDMTYDRDVDATPTISQAQLPSAGTSQQTLKASKKKPKKWSPLDLGSVDGEFDTNDAATLKIDDPVLEPPASDHGTYTTTKENQYTNQLQEFSPTQSIRSGDRCDSPFDGFDTLSANTFNIAFPELRSTPAKTAQERSIIHKEDPEDTKLRLEHIMARIDDVFDVEEWDPNLPPVNSNNSPEQLTVEPQKVTYTTVGSVAKTNALTMFKPPVRIQREGSARRLPTSRGSDNYYSRSQAPGNKSSPIYGPFTSQKTPMYTQQHRDLLSPFNTSELDNFNLSDLEKEILMETINSSTVGAPPGIVSTKQQSPQAVPAPEVSLSTASIGNFSIQKMLQEETSGHSTNLAGSSAFAGLNKMQTLQRLAQFDNPAQEFAKGRLAEFKAIKIKQQESDMTTFGAKHASQANSFERGNRGGMFQLDITEHDCYKSGIQGYGLQCPGQENGNPLQASFASSTCDFPMNGSRDQLVQHSYPQPLTAGPPRQGQNSVAFNKIACASGYSQPIGNPRQFQSQHVGKHHIPWNNAHRGFNQQAHNSFSSVVTENNHVRDTLSLAEMTKYYPNGFGSSLYLSGTYKELDNDAKLSNLGLTGVSSDAIKRHKIDKIDRWFYSGLSRFDMTTADHIEELECRDRGMLPAIRCLNLANRETLSVNQIKDKADSECATPLINNLFGTLMAYSDNVIQPENRRILSKFVISPPWALDVSEEGKKSIFDDNWAPPKRLGRDPRYHRSQLSQMWGADTNHCY